MSKLVYLCFNNKNLENSLVTNDNFGTLSKRINPDNITPNPVKIVKSKGIAFAVFNPMSTIGIEGTSVYLGNLIHADKNWWKPHASIPDGTFALFRGDDHCVEIVSDALGSRTIWYYYDDDMFIASTSQRAIVYFLGSFVLNTSAIAWMLSSGNLGYSNSWDSRIKRLKGNSKLTLDRTTWKFFEEEIDIPFTQEIKSYKHARDELESAILETIEGLNIDRTQWVLPLSGGYDSRMILSMLMKTNQQKINCVTWGVRTSLHDSKNDAYIAKKVADYFKCPHQYYNIEPSNELIIDIFDRFILSCEGRTDAISAYMDGLALWKEFFENGVHGIIRGDIPFSTNLPFHENFIRHIFGIRKLNYYSEFSILKNYVDNNQELDINLLRKINETLTEYRDRLHDSYRIPVYLAALSDVKLSYVEQINPFLSRKVVSVVRKLADKHRNDKRLFKNIVISNCPSIPIAKHSAIEEPRNILRHKDVVRVMKDKLLLIDKGGVLNRELINHVIKNIKINSGINNNPSPLNIIKRLFHGLKREIPGKFQWIGSYYLRRNLNYNTFAFRMYIIEKMVVTLTEDASIIANHTKMH